MQKFDTLLKQFWRPIVIGLVIALVTFGVLFMHLGTRPAALSAPEFATHEQSQSLHSIARDPIGAPLTLPEHLFIKLRPHGVAASRVAAVLLAIGALVLFFGIVRFWQNTLTAIIGTVMFGTSAWFLHVARLDTLDVLNFGILGLIACGLWLRHTLHRNILIFVVAASAAIACYIPGLVWFVIIGSIGAYPMIRHELRHTKTPAKVLAALLALLLLVPLGWALVRQPALTWTLLGLPKHWPGVVEILKNLGHVPLNLFVHGPNDAMRWLGRLPVLDIFEDVMLILGAYAFWHYRQLGRSRLLLGSAVIAILLIMSGGPVNLTILLPLLYLTIAAGVFYMLEVWLRVFPSNPVARTVGMAVLFIVIAISCWFQYKSYFVAWQNAPATQAVFTYPPNKL